MADLVAALEQSASTTPLHTALNGSLDRLPICIGDIGSTVLQGRNVIASSQAMQQLPIKLIDA